MLNTFTLLSDFYSLPSTVYLKSGSCLTQGIGIYLSDVTLSYPKGIRNSSVFFIQSQPHLYQGQGEAPKASFCFNFHQLLRGLELSMTQVPRYKHVKKKKKVLLCLCLFYLYSRSYSPAKTYQHS